MTMVINVGTELSAVNSIIYIIGESPVNSLDNSTSVDVINARTLLAQESRKLQDKGWTFNIQEGAQVASDVFSQQVVWRPSWLRVTETSTESPYVNRGGFLYDRLNRTDRFPNGVTINLIEEVPFNEMPYCFQTLATMKAARRFNSGSFGDPGTDAEAARLEEEARIACNEYELDYGNYSLFNDTVVQGLLGRG